ncbi:MAG: hypothetical protein P8P40_07900, partial [Sulfitobacter sp.]|nr:hypothetical protein [Sulfitobacter sp.]
MADYTQTSQGGFAAHEHPEYTVASSSSLGKLANLTGAAVLFVELLQRLEHLAQHLRRVLGNEARQRVFVGDLRSRNLPSAAHVEELLDAVVHDAQSQCVIGPLGNVKAARVVRAHVRVLKGIADCAFCV